MANLIWLDLYWVHRTQHMAEVPKERPLDRRNWETFALCWALEIIQEKARLEYRSL